MGLSLRNLGKKIVNVAENVTGLHPTQPVANPTPPALKAAPALPIFQKVAQVQAAKVAQAQPSNMQHDLGAIWNTIAPTHFINQVATLPEAIRSDIAAHTNNIQAMNAANVRLKAHVDNGKGLLNYQQTEHPTAANIARGTAEGVAQIAPYVVGAGVGGAVDGAAENAGAGFVERQVLKRAAAAGTNLALGTASNVATQAASGDKLNIPEAVKGSLFQAGVGAVLPGASKVDEALKEGGNVTKLTPSVMKAKAKDAQVTDKIIKDAQVPQKAAVALKTAETPAKVSLKPSYGSPANKVDTLTKALGSKVTVLRKIGTDSAHTLADAVENVDRTHQTLRATYRNQVPSVLALPKESMGNFWDVVEKKAAPESEAVAKAAQEWKALSPKVRQAGVDAGIKIGKQTNYLPKEYNPNVFKAGTAENATAASALVNAGKAKDIAEAQRVLRSYGSSSTKSTFGHFEKSRVPVDIPGGVKTKDVIERYLDNAARRTAEAQHFGANGETAQKLISNVGKEGGDAKLAAKAVGHYLNTPEGSAIDKPLGAVRSAYASTRLVKAAISHAIQTTNVAVDTRLQDFGAGWKDLVTRNPDAAQFVKEADTLNPANIHGLGQQETGVGSKLTKVTAPGLSTVMKGNRFVATIAGKNYGDWLALRGDADSLARLRQIGVTGDIGKELSRAQQLEAARGITNETMFNPSRATTPINAETGLGKAVGQYRTAYSYKQTGFLWNRVVKEAGKGNLAPLLKLAALSAPLTAGTVALKNKISGNKEGPGGIASDTIAAVGGLPGEIAESGIRYGRRDLTKTVASDVAPVLGEGVDLTTRVGKAINGNLKPVESYAAGLVPAVGSRLSKAINPAPDVAAAGTPEAKKGDATKELADIKKNATKSGEGYGLTQLSDGRYAYTMGGDVQTTKDLKSAQDAIAKDSFGKSDAKSKVIGDTYYYKNGQGKVASTSKGLHEYNVSNADNSLAMDTAYRASNLNGWLDAAQKQYDALEKKKSLYDPESEADKITTITNQQNDLLAKAQGYQTKGINDSGSTSSKTASEALDPNLHRVQVASGSGVSVPHLSFKAVSSSGNNKITYRTAARPKVTLKKGSSHRV